MADGSFEDDHAILPSLGDLKKDELNASYHDLESAIIKSISPKRSPITSVSTIEVFVEVHEEYPNVDTSRRKSSSVQFNSLSLAHLSLGEVERSYLLSNMGDSGEEEAQYSSSEHGHRGAGKLVENTVAFFLLRASILPCPD